MDRRSSKFPFTRATHFGYICLTHSHFYTGDRSDYKRQDQTNRLDAEFSRVSLKKHGNGLAQQGGVFNSTMYATPYQVGIARRQEPTPLISVLCPRSLQTTMGATYDLVAVGGVAVRESHRKRKAMPRARPPVCLPDAVPKTAADNLCEHLSVPARCAELLAWFKLLNKIHYSLSCQELLPSFIALGPTLKGLFGCFSKFGPL